MIAVEDTVLVLLAAGQSTRFGDVGSKLEEPFLGRPLGLHVAVALESMPFKRRIAVVDHDRDRLCRARVRSRSHNDAPDKGMAHSLRLGIALRAGDATPAAVLIALADMPRVTAAHIYRLFDATDGDDTVVASSDGVSPKPPALFGRDRFDALMSFTGDMGARDLVQGGRHVVTTPAELIDVDTPEDLGADISRGRLASTHRRVGRHSPGRVALAECQLFVTQRVDRVEARRAAGGEIAEHDADHRRNRRTPAG